MRGPVTLTAPWGNALGATRSAICLALALTLLLTPTSVLFTPLLGLPDGPHCDGVGGLSAFCLAGAEHVGTVRWLLAVVLLVAASGVAPAITAVPAAWAAASVAVSISIPDGGDQVAAILLLLLVGAGVTDPRRHHWAPLDDDARARRGAWATGVASVSVAVARLQVAVVYLFAAIGKFENPEWTEGSAIYYWVRHTSFGAPDYLAAPVDTLTAVPLVSAAITWGTLVLELALGVSLLLPERVRLRLLPVALLFHGGIAVLMGITSFSIIMSGAAVLLLGPVGASWVLRRRRAHPEVVPGPGGDADAGRSLPAPPVGIDDSDPRPLQEAEATR